MEGTVFAVDKATGTLVMKQEGLYGACTLRIIPMDQQLIKIDEGNGFKLASGPVEPLPKVDLARAKAREEVRPAELSGQRGDGVAKSSRRRES